MLLVTASTVIGCDGEVAHGLEETEANRVVAALADQGIAAETTSEGRQGERSWAVTVPSTELARARLVLNDRELPSQPEPGLGDVFGRSGLLPTPTEEQAMLIQAVQGELVETLESVDGVLSARVHLSVSEGRRALIPLEDTAPSTSASVLLRYAGDAPPLTEAQVKSLVSGAVLGLAPERVNVIMISRPQGARAGRCDMARLGPLSVSRSSLTPIRIGVAVIAVVIGLLGLGLVVLTLKTRSQRKRLEERAAPQLQ